MIKYLLLILPVMSFAQDSTVQKLEDLLEVYHTNNHFNGSVLISRKGVILLQKGYGVQNAENKALNTPESIYQIASVTKTFTSAVILKLIEQGRLSFDDKVSKFYKGFANGNEITIRNLLQHTSGIHNFTETDTTILASNEKQSIDFIRSLAPDFKPGTQWNYSNSGYVILGYIIEKVSGMSYWQVVRRYIFEPLQMTNSGFDFRQLVSSNKATGYDDLSDTVHHRATITDSTVPAGAGAIYSSVGDMYKWHQALQSHQVVRKELMSEAYEAGPLHNYGYGWQIDSVDGKKMVSHSGSISGFGSNFARIPDDDICIVLLNNKSGSTFDLMNITDKLLAILYQKPYTLPKKRTAVTLSVDVMKQYIGTYTIPEMNLTIEVTIYNNETLIAQPVRDGHPGPTSVLIPLSKTLFFDRQDTELEISFKPDAKGKFNEMEILQKGQTRIARKIK